MLRNKTCLSLIVLYFCSLAFAIQEQAPQQQEPLSLGEIARRYQQKKQSNVTAVNQSSEPETASGSEAGSPDAEDRYKLQVLQLFSQRNFSELERLASEARSTKGRFPGGVWKLYLFYEAFAQPAGPFPVADSGRKTELTILQDWLTTNPDSITAPVALATTYVGYALDARGGGFADTVTDTGWNLYEKRMEQARMALVDASRLKNRCPHWYEVMLQIATFQGWSKDKAKALFDEAVSFEPDYYHYYREYTNFLAPKWYGKEGEAEQFANKVASRMGGPQGAFLYFEMASVINCQCGSDEVHMANLSWPRIKQGYAALQQLYGSSNLKDNRFAYMAFLAKDKPAAREAFARIGSTGGAGTWRDAQNFQIVREWALSQ